MYDVRFDVRYSGDNGQGETSRIVQFRVESCGDEGTVPIEPPIVEPPVIVEPPEGERENGIRALLSDLANPVTIFLGVLAVILFFMIIIIALLLL